MTSLEDLPLVLTISEATEALRIGATTLRAAIKEGEIRSVRIRGTLRIPRYEVERLLSGEGA